MPFLSYAQNDEDVLLWRAFRGVGSGFYVDVGAADPDVDSVTRAFYDRGWRGINVEPAPGLARRLMAARPRDVTLAVAAGAAAGTAVLHTLEGTGLSTVDAGAAASLTRDGYRPHAVDVPVRPLSDILDEHAPEAVHFLKIDVEGAERAVLDGCDFRRHRPRIVLIEATAPNTAVPTHQAWEGLLESAEYTFAYFDGLNRFYLAREWAAELAPCFAVPVNVFDDVVRVRDARGVHEATAQLGLAIIRAKEAENSARAAYAHAFEQARDLGAARHLRYGLETALDDARAGRDAAERDGAAARETVRALAERAAVVERRMAQAEHLLDTTRHSTSWRITAPMRSVSAFVRRRQLPAAPNRPPLPVTAAPEPPKPPAPSPVFVPRHRTGSLRTVHQFHSGSATGDAVTNCMLLIRAQLRRLGYRSEIFVEHVDPALSHELRPLSSLPDDGAHVLVVHHSMGHDRLDAILANPAPKVLYYHNITPPEHLPTASPLRTYSARGRRQLTTMRPAIDAAVAASQYSAIELRRLGFDPVGVGTLLFDVAALRAKAARGHWRAEDRPYTVLFVGRVIESKAQADLVDAFAAFRTLLGRPALLVLAGRTDSPGKYLGVVDERMRAHGLEAELVVTGPISDEELHAQYSAADLYVSMSHHEGFGVPLMEAVAYGVPVLAWPCGAVAYTLPDGALESREPDSVAAAMLSIATDPARRAALQAAQSAVLDGYALPLQWGAMQEALSRAGAAAPRDPGLRAVLAPRLSFTVTGHAAGSYSLAGVNRDLVGAIEAVRPGRVRLLPVETVATTDLDTIPAPVRPLARRPAPPTGPEVVISQHYPVHVPTHRGDLTTALVFWEESLLPLTTAAVLTDEFDAVLAPTRSVAKALINSGVGRPVRVIGAAPDLSRFAALGQQRRAPEADGVFTFLHVSSCFPRKGVDVLLAAYARAFRRDDPVRLVIKGFPNPHNTVPDDVAATREADAGLAAIEVLDRDLDERALLELYASADAMVLPTRGEGLNLPAAEAMSAGLPLIVTDYGGHLDFCDAETARLVRYRLAPSGSHLASAHSLWAEPDEDDLVSALREAESARRDPDARSRMQSRIGKARAQVAARLGRRALVARLEQTALDLMLDPRRNAVRIAWVTSWGVACGVAEYARHLVEASVALPGGAEHVILSDTRCQHDPDASIRVRPSWRLGDPTSTGLFEDAVTAEAPDVLVFQYQPGLMQSEGLTAWLSSPVVAGRVSVVVMHNTRYLLDLAPSVLAPLCTALGRATRVLVHSLADLHRLQDLGMVENVCLMPHGVQSPRPAAPRTGGEAPLIGCYGFFLPGKGIGVLIEAVAALRRRWPGVLLRLVNAEYGGEPSAQELAACRALAARLGLSDAIEWHTGFLDDAESIDLLSQCDLVVLPTQASKESSSASARTALASGVPVIVTPLDIFADLGDSVARTGGTGAAEIEAGVDALLNDRARMLLQHDAARKWMKDRAWPSIAKRMLGLLTSLSKSHEKVSESFER